MMDISDIEKDIEATENRIRTIQHKTVEAVSFGPSGKVTVTDKPKLENLNTEIEAFQDLVAHNKEVLDRLLDLTGGSSLADLQLKKRRTEEHIARVKGVLSADLGELLKRNPGLNLENISSNPKAQKFQSDAKAILDREEPELEQINELLAKADTVLQDFKSSGLNAHGDYSAAITRSDVGVMV